jgi:hypothetical protein
MKDNGDVEFLDLFNPKQPRSGEELAAERLEICKTCKFYNQRFAKCMKCGCFMKLKTNLENAKCPVGKW